jgi:hypothetical protein
MAAARGSGRITNRVGDGALAVVWAVGGLAGACLYLRVLSLEANDAGSMHCGGVRCLAREWWLCEGERGEGGRQNLEVSESASLCAVFADQQDQRESGVVFSTPSVCQNKSGELILKDGVRT